jgi:hypothetical protein
LGCKDFRLKTKRAKEATDLETTRAMALGNAIPYVAYRA